MSTRVCVRIMDMKSNCPPHTVPRVPAHVGPIALNDVIRKLLDYRFSRSSAARQNLTRITWQQIGRDFETLVRLPRHRLARSIASFSNASNSFAYLSSGCRAGSPYPALYSYTAAHTVGPSLKSAALSYSINHSRHPNPLLPATPRPRNLVCSPRLSLRT